MDITISLDDEYLKKIILECLAKFHGQAKASSQQINTSQENQYLTRQYLSAEEVASKIGFSPDTVRIWLRIGELKGYKMGRPWRVKISDFNKFCEERGIDQT